MTMPMPSMEELFGKVQDLCTHGFGPRLYMELIAFLDKAAFVCASRLQNDIDMSANANASASATAPRYPTMNCTANTNMDMIYFTSLEEERPASEGSMMLNNVWGMYSDYLQFLNCVRSIFLSLDRMFLYLPPGKGQVEGTLLPRNANGSTATAVAGAARKQNDSGSDDAMGAGMSTSSGENTFVDLNATVAAAWDMWDVGMHCLWKHLSLTNDNVAVGSASTIATSASASASGETASTGNNMECSTVSQSDSGKISILDALKARTIQCILAELDLLRENSINADVHMSAPGVGNISANTEMLHKSLVRNCVSIFRALAHVSNGDNANTNINKNLLEDLVQEIIAYFQKESLQLVSDSGSNSSAPSKTSYDASFIIQHIANRRNQVNGMTIYYHLANDTVADSPTTDMLSHPLRKRQNRILVHLVEKFLLTPHFTTQLLLHPSNLYPILDNEEDSNNKDAKHLYELSKFVVHAPSHAKQSSHNQFAAITSSPGMELFRQAFEAYGKERGTTIMRSASAPLPIAPMGSGVKLPPQMTMREMNHKIVINLLQFKAHLEYLQVGSFAGNDFFAKTCRRVLEDILNNTEIGGPGEMSRRKARYAGHDSDAGKRIAELLAKYMDLRFKNVKASLASPSKSVGGRIASLASGGNADNDVESFQNGVLELFRHIQSKDVFEAFYRQDLSKRLLLNKSASIDAERSFVSKLKAECGTGYTSKMEGMFNDMELSKDVMSSYSAHLIGAGGSETGLSSGKMHMDVQVLTTGYWPAHTQYPSLIFPEALESRRNEFDTYYKTKYQGRRITWQNGLGNCILRASFPRINGPRELNVSLCQALVLLCFNLESDGEDIRLTIGVIMEKTGISDKGEAERVLQSLSMGRDGTQVLRRVESGRDCNADNANTDTTPRKKHKSIRKSISDRDLFSFNENFTSNQRRIRITNIQMKETTTDRKRTHESVILDRLHLTDAAIVRIMKARKTLDHRDLVGEVMNQLKFPASGVDVKKRVESLIEREYLERVEGDSSRYNYLA